MDKEKTEVVDNNQEAPEVEVKEKKGRKARKDAKSKLTKQLEEKDIELAEMKDKFLRLFAEFDNYKKRTIRERLELMKTAAQDTISDLLPILDDFDRAKQSSDNENTDEQFSDGVTLVYNKLYSVLKSKGLEQMETNGEVFNPEFHEAITKIPTPNEDMKGKVIDTIEKGYVLKDKIIRYAKVVVGE